MAKMVSKILEQKEAILLVLIADRSASNIVPTWQDLDVMQAIDRAISPLSTLTDILPGEKYVAISAVLSMLRILKTDLLVDECVSICSEGQQQGILVTVTLHLWLHQICHLRQKT